MTHGSMLVRCSIACGRKGYHTMQGPSDLCLYIYNVLYIYIFILWCVGICIHRRRRSRRNRERWGEDGAASTLPRAIEVKGKKKQRHWEGGDTYRQCVIMPSAHWMIPGSSRTIEGFSRTWSEDPQRGVRPRLIGTLPRRANREIAFTFFQFFKQRPGFSRNSHKFFFFALAGSWISDLHIYRFPKTKSHPHERNAVVLMQENIGLFNWWFSIVWFVMGFTCNPGWAGDQGKAFA